MTSWLDPIRRALDARAAPAAMFIRDDDGGWNSRALHALLAVTASRGVPVAVAVIPDAADAALGQALRRTDALLVALHQHGRAHVNHETVGRKCEFGPSRSAEQQRDDIVAGRNRLRDLLGDRLEPIFTPPWNRCTAATVRCLAELDFELLSRDSSASAFDDEPIAELPVSLDWTGRSGANAGAEAWGQTIARAVQDAERPVGLMLHHAVMSRTDLDLVAELLDVLTPHPAIALSTMRALGAARAPRGVM
jgi:hypothetical protein